MKYTDRKKTPLKWHHAVLFVFQPLLILSTAWLLLSMVNELFSLSVPFTVQIFTPALRMVNPSLNIHNLGSMFWPVTGTFFVTIVFLILCIRVWIGFFRWKRSAKNLWLIWLLVRTICLGSGVGYLMTHSQVLKALQTLSAFDSMSRGLLHVIYALTVVICLWNLIFLILNFIYYHKRKLLFAIDYIQPDAEEKENVSDIAEKETSEVTAPSSDSSETTEEPQKQSTEEPVSSETSDEKENTNQPTQSEPVEEDAQTSSKEQESADVSGKPEENKTEESDKEPENKDQETVETTEKQDSEETLPEKDPNQVFCPYCGARLGKYDVVYCSHCGRKIA